jgi:Ca-activated chloride channel family protein
MFRFANPQAFEFLWAIPVLVISAWFLQRQTRARIHKAFGKRLGPFLSASVSPSKRRFKLILKLSALFFLVLALARPQMGKSTQTIKSEGVELMIAVDVSNSMLAEDLKPSRIEYAKAELSRLLDLLEGDKVGVIAFAGSATLLSPLTPDKAALKMYLEGLSPLSVENQGTEFRKAMREGKSAFEHGGVDADDGVKVTRVILIASDGEDQEPGALDEAKKLSQDGIRIFTLAFGSDHGAPIPQRDQRGYLQGYKKDRAGHEIMTQVNDDVLRSIAQAGHGSFYHVSPGGAEAKKIKADLDRLEKAQFDSTMATNYDEKYQIFLLISLLLVLADLSLGERKKIGRLWKGRFEVPQA